ncbi:MAG TPA: SDR family NAD(P)-dependent oxidoreductase [Thermoleophilaceae bacterium]
MTDSTIRTTPFGFESTAAEVVAGIDLDGKRAIVTGGSSGIGVETARTLASAGAEVTITGRNLDAGANVVADIRATTANPAVDLQALDLADQASVAAFADSWSGPLHILVNNAGIMAVPELQRTKEGWELQFATNHLGHFALAVRLHDALAEAGNARIVSLSSRGHHYSPVVFEDINFESRPYDPWLAYGQSKTANVLFAVEAARRWAGDGITANAVHPGGIHTNLMRYMDPETVENTVNNFRRGLKTPEQGAATSVLVATSLQLEGIGGRYFEDCNEAVVVEPGGPDDRRAGVVTYALDPDNASRLWRVSEDLIAAA